ncbi:hypothetical protein KP509_22G033200 [Ceratopteris richardii]|uniref:ABC1 atypical kinase-like domain-containing protein n=1 Tax=Ceratopteris richardii TaxID=49495 RepID=A0A8T2S741_CERRI|nr:hypothetical protein KP509_22G033200 [Ceratopteris richardii]
MHHSLRVLHRSVSPYYYSVQPLRVSWFARFHHGSRNIVHEMSANSKDWNHRFQRVQSRTIRACLGQRIKFFSPFPRTRTHHCCQHKGCNPNATPRPYSCVHTHLLPVAELNVYTLKRFDLCNWRTTFERIFGTPRLRMSNSVLVETMAKVVTLACTRAHIPLCIMAFILGGSQVAHSQAKGVPLPSTHHRSFVSSTISDIVEFCSLVTRSFYLLFLFTPVFSMAPFVSMFGGYFRNSWFDLIHHTLELAGPAFIKWGQWAASRPDLFPKGLCARLTELQSNAPAHSYVFTVKAIEKSFGRPLDEIFLDFEEKPVASGSIAQVHKAILKEEATLDKPKEPMTVAVKVRHPGVIDIIRRDFRIINSVAKLCNLIPGMKWLRLDESVRQFSVFMMTQVDLAREAAHLSRFSYNFRSWKDVCFPCPVYPFVHPAILVESFERGENVSNFIDLSDNSNVNRKLAHLGSSTVLKMLLEDNFIHADMHPGNILVRINRGTRKQKRSGLFLQHSRPQLVFLDVGLTAELTQNDRNNLLQFFKAVSFKDGRTAAQYALEFSKNQSCPDPAAFVKDVEMSFKLWNSKEGEFIPPGECIQEVFEKVRSHRVNIDGDLCMVMVSFMVLEGWQRKLDPDFNALHNLQKLFAKQDLRDSLLYILNAVMSP